ncbi:MAG: hypothetical protein P4L80_16440 [Xanthobacteraceae bacterium]|nr:hypothetical protein [Xanthobacteraceae bacterium]
MAQPVPLYIVASPRPRNGKTLIARLLMEFLRQNRRPTVGYDLNPREPALAERFPKLVWPVDIADTRGQMELFDRLLADPASTQVIDLGYGPFDQFFAVMREIGFVQEARRRGIEPIVLFVADSSAATARSYAQLRRRLAATFVPVHNESVALLFAKEDFPPTRTEYGLISIPRLSPLVRGVIDRPNFSFNAYMAKQSGGPTEVHQWIGNIYAEFRDFELRLLMGRLSSSLGGAPAPKRKDRRVR